jgi:choice-of-anchor A domain-containing protein
LVVVVLGGLVVVFGGRSSASEVPTARVAQGECGSLGEAAAYDVFSDGSYAADNTQVNGRVAARGDVAVSQIGMGFATSGGYDVVAGGDITGSGGQVQGDVRYGGALRFDPTFAVVGESSKGEPPFSFDAQFAKLRELSASLAELPDTPGNTVVKQDDGALHFGSTDGARDRYVFNVSGSRLAGETGLVIDLPAGATAIFNVTGTQIAVTQTSYINLTGGIDAGHILWNFEGVEKFTLEPPVEWQGTLLAPNTVVEKLANAQNINGQVIAKEARLNALAIVRAPFAGCLPQPEPEPEPIELKGLCADAKGNLSMRLRNTGTRDLEDVVWRDLDSPQGGSFTSFGGQDRYFHVDAADGKTHRIRVTAGATTVEASARPRACRGRLTVHEQVVGQGPGGEWKVVLSGADGPVGSVDLGDGETFSSGRVPGGYVEGSVAIGENPGGVQYTISEPDPRGGVATVSQYLIEVTDGDATEVNVTTFYRGTPIIPIQPPTVPIRPTDPIRPVLPTDPVRPVIPPPTDPTRPILPTDPITPVVPTDPVRPVIPPPTDPTRPPLPTDPIRPIPPTDPTIPVVPTDPVRPPGPPQPPTGPGLIPAPPGVQAADLRITYTITPRRFRVGQTVRSVIRIRNHGQVAAVGTVLREVPQFPGARLQQTSRILTLTAAASGCRRPRPARCELGTLAPGKQVTVRARTRVLVPGVLSSTVLASSRTAETNLTNNVAIADLTGREPTPRVDVRVDAPRVGRVGIPLTYRVTVTGSGATGARAARLCSRIPASFTERRAPGTFRYQGMRCHDYAPLRKGQSRSFAVHAIPTGAGSISVPAVAGAIGTTRIARDDDRIRILGVRTSACVATARRTLC